MIVREDDPLPKKHKHIFENKPGIVERLEVLGHGSTSFLNIGTKARKVGDRLLWYFTHQDDEVKDRAVAERN